MSNFIIAIAVFLITVVGALFAIPYFVDWNGYRSVFEEEATRLLGREVRVGGAVNLHLLPTPYFRFEKVRIADASVNLQEPFFRADSLTVKLAIPPMVRGVLEANDIELLRPVLHLALDSADGWNWQSFGEALARAAFLPAKVTLSSVKIVEGVLALHGPDGAERTRLEGFDGELSTPALEGPYRLRGTFGTQGLDRELRVATARAEGDGTLRFKAVLRVDGGASTYVIDGRVADLMGKPSIEGDLSARVPVAGLWQAQPTTPLRVPRKPMRSDPEEKGEAAFDLRAQLRADPAGATLSDLSLAFEQDGRPQLISGEVKAAWRTALAVELSLTSRWLDLDRIAGAGEGAGPLASIVPLAAGLRDLLPGESRSRATISIDQANVGHEAVSGVHLALVRSAGKLAIEDLRLGLPGGSRGELQGSFTGPPEAPVFEGSVGLRGTSLVRFLAWATAGAVALDPKGDGSFGARAQLAMTPGRAAFRNIIGDLSGGAIFADAQYGWEGRPELRLRVESPQLDARAFFPAGASLVEVFDLALRGPVMSPSRGQHANAGLGASKPAWRGPQADAFIRLNAGQLFTATRSYRDVGVEIAIEGGRLRIPALRLAGDEGFSLELEGEVDDAALHPKGNLRGIVVADRGSGIAPLAELIGVPEVFRPDDKRAKAVAPLRLAGSIAFGARTSTSVDLVVDGEANGAGAKLNARLDGGPAGWRTGPADVTGLIESNDAQAVAAILAPGAPPGRAASAAPGRVVVKATGVPNAGLASLASVTAGDLALEFRGRMVASEGGNTAQGTLDIKSADGGRLAGLAGLQPPLRLDGVPVGGSLKLALDKSKIALERLALNVAGSSVRGELAIASVGERRQITAGLDVDGVTLAGLLAVVQDQRLAVAAAAESAVSGRSSVWSEDAFDGAGLDGFEGHVKLSAKRLTLTDGLGLDDASLDIALQSGKIDVRELAGACLGGRCRAQFGIAKTLGGVDVSGSLRLAGLAMASLGEPRATGSIGGEIKFSGKGVSPRGVFSVLQGSGALELAGVKLPTLWPGAVGMAIEAALRSNPDSLNATLKQALGAGLGAGELTLPGEIAVDIADGRLAVRPIAIDTPEGRVEGTATLDLKSLQIESAWRLEAKAAGGADRAPLPAVTVGYRGSVTALGGLEPRIDADALQRELAVRRMERDVEELERLRRLDEARRREEMERQRRQLEQAPVPGPVPVAPVVPAPRPATPG
jgi:uncharacterized protein involved in outer membrane biogenesis